MFPNKLKGLPKNTKDTKNKTEKTQAAHKMLFYSLNQDKYCTINEF